MDQPKFIKFTDISDEDHLLRIDRIITVERGVGTMGGCVISFIDADGQAGLVKAKSTVTEFWGLLPTAWKHP